MGGTTQTPVSGRESTLEKQPDVCDHTTVVEAANGFHKTVDVAAPTGSSNKATCRVCRMGRIPIDAEAIVGHGQVEVITSAH